MASVSPAGSASISFRASTQCSELLADAVGIADRAQGAHGSLSQVLAVGVEGGGLDNQGSGFGRSGCGEEFCEGEAGLNSVTAQLFAVGFDPVVVAFFGEGAGVGGDCGAEQADADGRVGHG